ncbi:unnamed protein product [Calypogeia fissa]
MSIRTFLVLCFAVSSLIGQEWFSAVASDDDWENGEAFSEDLFLRPLPDGKVLFHFYFKNTLNNLGSAAHHHVFPKAISQLVKKFHVSEMELSFTQGRWNYERWGSLDPIASDNAKPLGVELWAAFDLPLDQVDPTWRNLTHALSGLFCASINFLESPATMAAPEFAFGPDLGESGTLRYGALPREAVCTENLTPWLKLLPCRDKAGIATLLDRPSIYRGYYHSLRVRLSSGSSKLDWTPPASKEVVLEQTLTLVLQPSQPRERSSIKVLPHWSLSSVFGRRLEGSCPLAKTSHVLLELESSLVEKVHSSDASKDKARLQDQNSDSVTGKDSGNADVEGKSEINLADNSLFSLTPYPERVFYEAREGDGDNTHPSLLLDYVLEGYSRERPLNLGMLWKEKVSWASVWGPFRVSRFLVGSGNQLGSIVIELKSNDQNLQKRQEPVMDDSYNAESTAIRDTIDVTIFHMVPWYVRLYTHTLTAVANGYHVPLREVATRMRIFPAEDRLSPAVLEIQLQLPSNVSILSLKVEFDKAFLHIDEHPPDANRGFDLPSALISFPTSGTQRRYGTSGVMSTENGSPFLQTLQGAGPVHIYSESLLVPLATPDFSMPYNVITFTCTVLALYFGSLLNTLRRRIGEEERRLAKPKDQQQGKLRQMLCRYMEGKSETTEEADKDGWCRGCCGYCYCG